MTTFSFPIRKNLRAAWGLFVAHYLYFGVFALVMVVCNFLTQRHSGIIMQLLIIILSTIWGYVGISSALAAVKGKTATLTLDSLVLHLPSVKEFFLLIGLSIATSLFVLAGFIMLILPGIYFLVRLALSQFAFVDRKEGIVASMKHSWALVKGDRFWTGLLVLVVAGAVVIVGVLLFGVGVLVAYPVALIFLALFYVALEHAFVHETAVAPQPVEIAPFEKENEKEE